MIGWAPPIGYSWWTLDTDADGHDVWKRTRVHAWRELELEGDPSDPEYVYLYGVTLCGVRLGSGNENQAAAGPVAVTCKRCLRSLKKDAGAAWHPRNAGQAPAREGVNAEG